MIDLILIATVWLAPKQEYNGDISSIDPQLAGNTVSTKERDAVLSRLAKIIWDFQSSLYGKLSNLDNKAAFQANIYKNIDPETAKAIIAETHCPNDAMQDISTLVNRLPIIFLKRNEIDRNIIKFEDNYVGCELLFYSPVTKFYTRHTDRFLMV